MNTKTNIVITGGLLLTTGILTTLMGGELSPVMRYLHAGVLGSAGIFGLITGQESRMMNGRSKYYTGLGLTVITLSMALGVFGTTAAAFISIVGFFLLLLGTVGFAFAQQLMVDRESGSTTAGVKFLVGTLLAVGGAWILTIPESHLKIGFLVSGGLFVLIGLALIHLGRVLGIEKHTDHSGL